jgi:predicted  nucleic acid-binding Zn-ribbon protein
MDDLRQRLQQLEQQIPNIKNRQARRELVMMLKSANSALTRVDQELVECRRRQRPTVKYQDLVTEADKVLKFVEQHLTFAALLNG